jgi:hypothetical protein
VLTIWLCATFLVTINMPSTATQQLLKLGENETEINIYRILWNHPIIVKNTIA